MADRFVVSVPQTGERFACGPDEPILRAMAKVGRRGIPVGCLNGGCGVCKVRVVRGRCRETGPVSREHVSLAEAAEGCTLACRAAPEGDVELEVMGRMRKGFLARASPASPLFGQGAASDSTQSTAAHGAAIQRKPEETESWV